jgi:hypothetical protein
MGLEMLNNGFTHVTENLYTCKHSYERMKNFFRTYRYPKTDVKVKESIPFSLVVSILKGLIKLGVIDKDRYYFWKLILWTVSYNKKHIDLAVLYTTMMHQMRANYGSILKKMET